jgi:hypothetical protein
VKEIAFFMNKVFGYRLLMFISIGFLFGFLNEKAYFLLVSLPVTWICYSKLYGLLSSLEVRMRKLFKNKVFWTIIVLLLFIYLNNSSLLSKPRTEAPKLLAHRGMAQTFHMEGITDDTCTAGRIYPPEHPYLENTISSMQVAFQAGADMVELDIHPTKDGKFAVFHDWTLDCRTNGKGVTRDHTMAELKTLDIGYGYTADEGKTYPFSILGR